MRSETSAFMAPSRDAAGCRFLEFVTDGEVLLYGFTFPPDDRCIFRMK
jgi:hypothetical protein